MDENFRKSVEKILEKDSRYHSAAYYFLSEAVSYTVKKLSRQAAPNGTRHVSGQELTAGFMDYAVAQYGLLAPDVLEDWNVRRGRDVGNMVYNMIGAGLLSAGPGDQLSDFECHETLSRELRVKVDRSLLLPDPDGAPLLDL
jgi:uncharacterized repeat protein (TIGR04138 family)